MLAEECGEVIQIVGKILRHGYDSHHPDGGPDNREHLERELGDILAVALIMDADNKDFSMENVVDYRNAKLNRIHKYTHHQRGSEQPETTE